MSEIRIKIKGLNRLQRALRESPRISEPILQRTIDASQAVMAKHTVRGVVPWKTGNLLQSFRFSRGRLRARWFPKANYALFVHEGTRPHTIRVRNKRVLANKKTGQIFGTVVNHPGMKPNRYMNRIVDRSERDIKTLFQRAAEKIASAIARKI
ncbi:MAG: hypothetical protein KJI72_00220 [Patescibacteria group bacterium]|nr:hypothetical protein [Patescibacteria group bacterium]